MFYGRWPSPRPALYFQVPERIRRIEADSGLVGDVVEPDQLDACISQLVDAFTQGGPALAQKEERFVTVLVKIDKTISETAQRIARQRTTDEAKDGTATSFLDKRPPAWL